MSEPLGTTRVKAPVKLARVRAPHPPPLVTQRPAAPSEIPPAAMRFLRAALAAEWHAAAFYALGWGIDAHGVLTQRLKASVLLRLRRGDERVTALWSTPWPVPDGVEVPPLPSYDLPAGGHVLVLRRLLEGQDAAEARERPPAVVKWAYELGCHWTRPASPLEVSWWSATDLRAKVTAT